MAQTKAKAPVPRDENVPRGYGSLVGVTSHGSKDAVLWFEDSAGTIRAVLMECERGKGLSLAMKGQAVIQRP